MTDTLLSFLFTECFVLQSLSVNYRYISLCCATLNFPAILTRMLSERPFLLCSTERSCAHSVCPCPRNQCVSDKSHATSLLETYGQKDLIQGYAENMVVKIHDQRMSSPSSPSSSPRFANLSGLHQAYVIPLS